MTKKKIDSIELPPKTWKKLVMIQTGEGFLSRADYSAYRGYGFSGGCPEVEKEIFETTEPAIISFAEALQSKDEEIKRLKTVILEFKAAQEKVMAQS